MSQEEAAAARQRIIRLSRKIIRENEQIIRDVIYWNDNVRAVKFPDDSPIDVEPCRIVIHKARQVLANALAWRRSPQGLMDEMIEAASEELM